MSLKFYEDMNILEKILYRLHLKRAISFSKKDLNDLVSSTRFSENCLKEDCSYNDYLSRHFSGGQNLLLNQMNTEQR